MMQTQCGTERRQKRCRRKPLDGRTRLARHIKALATAYVAGLAVPATAELQEQCRRAAEMVAIADDARRKAVNGAVSLNDVVRLSNAADRARRALPLKEPKPDSGLPSLSELLRRREAALATP
jgi:hypothetical protein